MHISRNLLIYYSLINLNTDINSMKQRLLIIDREFIIVISQSLTLEDADWCKFCLRLSSPATVAEKVQACAPLRHSFSSPTTTGWS